MCCETPSRLYTHIHGKTARSRTSTTPQQRKTEIVTNRFVLFLFCLKLLPQSRGKSYLLSIHNKNVWITLNDYGLSRGRLSPCSVQRFPDSSYMFSIVL